MSETIQAEVTAVEDVYSAAPVGSWRVTVRFHNRGTATFVHVGVVAPKAGDTWEMENPVLGRRAAEAPAKSKAQEVASKLYDQFMKNGQIRGG